MFFNLNLNKRNYYESHQMTQLLLLNRFLMFVSDGQGNVRSHGRYDPILHP